MMLIPSFIDDDESTLGLVKEVLDKFRVSFIARVDNFHAEKQTVDITPVVTESTYVPGGSTQNVAWPPMLDVPICPLSWGSWVFTMPVEVGSTVLVLCTDLDFKNWYKRNQVTNTSSHEYHSLNNAIAVGGIKPLPKIIQDFFLDGPEIRNTVGQFSMKISENGILLSIGSNLSLEIGSSSIIIKIGGSIIATVDSSGVTIDTLDITIQGTKIFEWLTTHTHSYVSPSGPAMTGPAGPQG